MRKTLPAHAVTPENLASLLEAFHYRVDIEDDGDLVVNSHELKMIVTVMAHQVRVYASMVIDTQFGIDIVKNCAHDFNVRVVGVSAFTATREDSVPLLVFETDMDFDDGLSVKNFILRLRRFESQIFQANEFKAPVAKARGTGEPRAAETVPTVN